MTKKKSIGQELVEGPAEFKDQLAMLNEIERLRVLLGLIAEHAAQMEYELYKDSDEWVTSRLVSECLAETQTGWYRSVWPRRKPVGIGVFGRDAKTERR